MTSIGSNYCKLSNCLVRQCTLFGCPFFLIRINLFPSCKQAQAAIMDAVPRLKALGVKIKKPNDYIAEMVKSEAHMERVKKAHAEREAIMEKIEKVKRARKDRKMAKVVQNQVKLAKKEERKEFDQKIAKFKKGVDKSLDFLDETKRPTSKSPKNANKIKKQTKKQAYKQQRFGMGGQKKRKKYNTAESAADVSSFNRRHNSGNNKMKGKTGRGFKGGKGTKGIKSGRGGKSKSKNRPGKERRKAMKMKSKRK